MPGHPATRPGPTKTMTVAFVGAFVLLSAFSEQARRV
jgi:hypothetical protein